MKTTARDTELVTLGGGCFFYMDTIFRQLKGVVNVTAGYSYEFGFNKPSLSSFREGANSCTEVVQVEYIPKEIAFEDLIVIFLTIHNPTLHNQQGQNIGTQYRSIIFYENLEEKEAIDILIEEMKPYYPKPIITEVKKIQPFYKEDIEYQSFYGKSKHFGYLTSIFEPRIHQFRAKFCGKLKTYLD